MQKFTVTLLGTAVLSACTHGAVSTTPMELQGIGTVYRYQGRANFSHQIAEADKMMAEHCKQVNGGKPVIVAQQQRDLGMVGTTSSSANTNLNAMTTRMGNQALIAGSATTNSKGSFSALRNMNQEILYRCVAN